MRLFWITLGLCCVAAAIAGVVLPLVPATPFLLLAAFAFSRGSPRLEAWLVNHARFGPIINNWRAEGAIGRRAKLLALAMIAATPVITWIIGAGATVLAIQVAVLSAVAAFIATRPEPSGE